MSNNILSLHIITLRMTVTVARPANEVRNG